MTKRKSKTSTTAASAPTRQGHAAQADVGGPTFQTSARQECRSDGCGRGDARDRAGNARPQHRPRRGPREAS